MSLTFRVLATFALAAFVLQRIEWDSLVRILNALQWKWFIAGQTIAITIQVVAGIRWSALAKPIWIPSFYELFHMAFFRRRLF